MANADIHLLFGVARGGAVAQDSEEQIRKDLQEIISEINKDSLKIKVALDTESANKSSWTKQLQKKLDSFNENNKLAITVSNIKLGSGAISSFKKQLSAVINTLNLDKGTSITLTAEGIGEIKKKMQEAGDDATEAARKVAEFKVQMEALGGLKTSVHTALNSLSKNAGSEERAQISALTAQYEQWAIKIEAVRASKNSVSDTYRAELEAEGTAIQKSINAITQKLQALNISRDAYADATRAIKDYYSTLTFLIKSDSDVTLNGATWESESGNYSELAEALNRTKTAYDQVIGAMANMPLEQQANLKRLLTEQTNKYNLALEKQANAERQAAESSEQAAADAAVNVTTYRAQLDKVNNALIQAKKNLELWTAAKTGKTSGSYFDIETAVHELENLKQELLNEGRVVGGFGERFTKQNSKIKNASENIRAAGENTKSFTERVGTLAGKFSSWLTVSQVIMQVYQSLKQMVTAVIEVDTAMTELRKVTNETEETYSKFIETASRRSKELGATISDTITASADFARLGFSLDEASALADAAIVYKNVGDGITDITMASESIISTMKAFGVAAEDAMFIVDKFNEVGNNFAISSKGVGDALLRSASALAAGNNTLDESIALITAANSTIQDADKVGTTLKTVSMFLRAAKTEAEEAGESTEGMANSVSELRTEILALTGNEVDIQIDENTFKSTYQIMKELSEVWDELTDISRANILEMIGGKRNSNVVMSLIENFEVAEEVIASAADAAGSALEENAKHLASIEGAISKFKATFDELSITLIDGEFVEDIVNIGTGLLNILNIVAKVVDALGGLKTVLIAVASAFLMAKNGALAFAVLETVMNLFKTLHAGILNVVNIIPNAVAAWKAYTTSAAGATAANTALQASIPVIGLVLAAISALVAVISLFNRKSVEETKKSLKELKSEFKSLSDSISSTASEFRNLRSTAEEVIPRFAELAKGVNALGENAKLTDKEYAEFLSLNNQIAEMFPELNLGMDSNGNAMLTLSYTADTLADSLWNVVDAQREAANASIAASMPEVLENVKGQVSDYKDFISDVEEETTFLLDMMEKKSKGSYDFSINTTSSDPNKIFKFSDEAYKYFDLLKKYGIEYEVKRAERASNYFDIIIKDQEAAERAISQSREKLVNNYTNEMNTAWESLNSIAIAWAKTNPLYDELNEPMQNIAQYMIRGLNFGKLGKTTEKEIQDYVQGSIITPLSNADKPIRDTFAKITDWQKMLENGEIDNDTFAENVRGAFELLFDAMSPSYVEKFKAHFVDGMNQMGGAGDNFADALNYLIAEWGRVEQTVQSSKTLHDTVNKFRDIISVLKSASDEYRNMGSVSTDTYNDVIALGEDYADLFDFTNGKIELESETLGEFVDKLMQEYGAMLAANGATDAQIASLMAYAKAAEDATISLDEMMQQVEALASVYEKAKAGETLGALEMLDIIDTYPELIGAISDTTEGYKLETEAVLNLIKAKLELTKIDSMDVRKSARAELSKYVSSPHQADKIDEIFANNDIASMEQFISAWEDHFSKSYTGGWSKAYKDYVNAVISDEAYKKLVDSVLDKIAQGDFGLKDENKKSPEEIAFEEEYKKHQHLLAMDMETVEEYINWLEKAYKTAGLEQDELYKYEQEVYSKRKELFESHLGDLEHDIFLIEQAEGSSEKIIDIYRRMQSDVHDQAQMYRKRGLAEDSDLIEELQRKWWDYEKKISAIRESIFKDRLADAKFSIDVLKHNDASSEQIISAWKDILSDINNEISYYTSLGEDITSEALQNLLNEAWSAKEEILAAIKQTVDDANDILDGFEDIYSTLTDAAKEYASTGYLSSDSLQAILELSPKYLSFLYDESGQLVINERALQDIIAAKTEDMAVTNALAYAKQILNAVEQDDISALVELTNITTQSSNATWDMAYATLALAKAMGVAKGMDTDYFDAAESYISKMQSLSKTASSTVSAYYATLKDGYINQSDALDQIIQLTQDLIRWENEQLIKSLEDEKNAYSKIIDQKKEALRLSKEQADRDRDTADKVGEIAKLQSRIEQLALDDSREALAQRRQLEEQLNELQKQLADDQADYAYNAQIDSLDKQKTAYEDEKDKEISALGDMLTSAEQLYSAAIERINSGWDTLYQELLDWNYNYGSTLQKDLVSAWDAASAAVQRYGSFVAALDGTSSHTNLGQNFSAGGTATAGGIIAAMKENSLRWFTADSAQRADIEARQLTLASKYGELTGNTLTKSGGSWYLPGGDALYQLTAQQIISYVVDAMKRNSALWQTTVDIETKNRLAEDNQRLAEVLEPYLGEKLNRTSDGVWWIGNKKLYEVYHSGGIVGQDPTLKQNEVLTILEKGETVLDKPKEEGLYKIVDFIDILSQRLGKVINKDAVWRLFNNIPRPAPLVRSPNEIMGNAEQTITSFSPIVNVNITHNGSLSEEDARRYGEIAANTTIDGIRDAFLRKGISSLSDAVLKPN